MPPRGRGCYFVKQIRNFSVGVDKVAFASSQLRMTQIVFLLVIFEFYFLNSQLDKFFEKIYLEQIVVV